MESYESYRMPFSIIHLKAGRLGHLPTGSWSILVEGVSFCRAFEIL